MNTDRKGRRLMGVLLLLAALLMVSVSGVFVWSPVNCWHDDIDIRSGRVRYTRYFLFCRVSDRVSTSPVSEALLPSDYDADFPDWRRVNTFSPGVWYSPHYSYHSANYQIHTLKMLWRAAEFTPAARRQCALTLILAWQRGSGDSAAIPFLHALSELVVEHTVANSTKPIDVPDLPDAGGND